MLSCMMARAPIADSNLNSGCVAQSIASKQYDCSGLSDYLERQRTINPV